MVDSRNICLVTARGGSKRLPRKNVTDLGGMPLVGHSLDVAVQSGCFGRVVLSSDDPAILAAAGGFPGVETDARQLDLATDKVKVIDVVLEFVTRPEIERYFDTVTLLLPTAPFRRPSDVQAGFARLDRDVDCVLSVTDYDFPPQMGVQLDSSGNLLPIFDPSPLLTGNTRSQDQVPAYRPNGGFFIAWIDRLKENRSFYRGKPRGYVMPKLNSVDIDDQEDMNVARALLAAGLVDLGRALPGKI